MDAIRFNAVSKLFGDVVALDRLSCAIPAGKLTGFLGPNGAGKTTSFRALLGVTRIDSGAIDVLGMDVSRHAPAIVKRVGAIVEDPGHHGALTGRSNLEIAAATLGRGAEQIDHLLNRVGLSNDADRKVSGYSKGMRQRLGLAVALLGDPELLVLDEPLDGLDPAGQVAFKTQLRALVDEHRSTVVVSSHDLRDIEELADHVVVIDHGTLVVQGPLGALLESEPRIRVRIDDLADATEILESGGFGVRTDNGDLLVATDDGSRIAQLLAKNDRYPRALIPESTSLEQAFLRLTNEEAS